MFFPCSNLKNGGRERLMLVLLLDTKAACDPLYVVSTSRITTYIEISVENLIWRR
jgi:hypothetical protein